MTTATLPSTTGIVSSYSYDNADRLTGISHVQNGSTTIASVAYTLDTVGNRTQRVDQQGTHTYAYDNLYRMTSAAYPGTGTTSYAYDAFGNRTSMTTPSGTTTYAYDNAERLTTVTPPGSGAVTYTWDNNGNLTNRGSDTFAWDYENRLVSATVSGVTSSFAYRGDGLRNSRTVGANTTTFTWDVAGGLPVVLDDGSARYVYGNGLVSQVSGANTYYYLADGLGSVMKTTDQNGNVVNSYAYDVYGKTTSQSGSQPNEFQFAGEQGDASTGLQYLRARYYDPNTGTFLSRDPMAASPGWGGHPFGYGGSNPANATDPTGLCWARPSCWGDGAAAAAGAVGEAVESIATGVVEAITAVPDGLAEQLTGLAAYFMKPIWVGIRAAVNFELTGLAIGAAEAGGGSCDLGPELFYVCTGVKAMDSINQGGMTFGNVYILGETYRHQKLEPASIAHEMRHADEWAVFGLSTFPYPLAGQQYMAATFVGFQAALGACGNPFEILAGLGNGGYQC